MEFQSKEGTIKMRNRGFSWRRTKKGSYTNASDKVGYRQYFSFRHLGSVTLGEDSRGFWVGFTLPEISATTFAFHNVKAAEAFYNKLVSKIEKNPDEKDVGRW